MWTVIVYDGNEYYQVSADLVLTDIRRVLPRGHEIVFAIPDDVEVMDGDGEELESRSL